MKNTKQLPLIKASRDTTEAFSNEIPWFLKFIPPLLLLFLKIAPETCARFLFFMASRPRFKAKHKTTDKLLAQFDDSGFFKSSKEKLAYKTWGKSGELVVLVHGWESRGTALRGIIPPLLEKGFKVMAIDLPAHGDSTGFNTNLVESGTQLSELLAHYKPSYLVAHSFGTAVSTYAMSLGNVSFLKKVVLVAVPVSTIRIFQNVLDTIKLPYSLIDYFNNFVKKNYNTSLEALDLRELYQHTPMLETLVIHDKKDPVVPFESSAELAERYPSITLFPTEGFGHFRLLKNSKILEQAVLFINGEIEGTTAS